MDNENEIDSDAQDPNIEVEEGNEEGEGRSKGAQPRINELTAKFRDAERKLQEAQSENVALRAARLVEGNRPAPVIEEVDEFPDMDPSVKALMNKKLGKLEAAFSQRLAATQAEYESRFMAQEAAGIAAQHGGDEKTQEQARVYAAGLRKKGLNVSSEEAAIFALGMAVKEGRFNAPTGSAPQQPQRRGAPPMGNVRGPSFNAPLPASEKPLPSNFDSLSPDQQLAILEKRGAGDKPI